MLHEHLFENKNLRKVVVYYYRKFHDYIFSVRAQQKNSESGKDTILTTHIFFVQRLLPK